MKHQQLFDKQQNFLLFGPKKKKKKLLGAGELSLVINCLVFRFSSIFSMKQTAVYLPLISMKWYVTQSWNSTKHKEINQKKSRLAYGTRGMARSIWNYLQLLTSVYYSHRHQGAEAGRTPDGIQNYSSESTVHNTSSVW